MASWGGRKRGPEATAGGFWVPWALREPNQCHALGLVLTGTGSRGRHRLKRLLLPNVLHCSSWQEASTQARQPPSPSPPQLARLCPLSRTGSHAPQREEGKWGRGYCWASTVCWGEDRGSSGPGALTVMTPQGQGGCLPRRAGCGEWNQRRRVSTHGGGWGEGGMQMRLLTWRQTPEHNAFLSSTCHAQLHRRLWDPLSDSGHQDHSG